MKKPVLLFLFLKLIVLTSCDKSELAQNQGKLTFKASTEIIVNYREIIAYDSAQQVFLLDSYACDKIKDKITPSYPDPHFSFGVFIDDELIYDVSYIPGYHSYSFPEKIKFYAIGSEYLFLYYSNNEFKKELNDLRIIELLKQDNKLKTIDLEVE